MTEGRSLSFLHLVVVCTLISTVGFFFGIRVSSVGWIVPLLASIISFLTRVRWIHIRRFAMWAPWILYSGGALIFSHPENSVIRTMLMYCPLVVGVAATTYAPSEGEYKRIFNSLRVAAVLLLAILFVRSRLGSGEEAFFLAAESMTAVLFATIFAVHVLLTGSFVSLMSWFAMALVPILSLSRVATVAVGIVLPLAIAPISALVRGLTGLVIVIGALSLFYSSGFQEKMFSGGTGNISDLLSGGGDVQASGRVEIWAALIEGIARDPWVGHGPNASQAVVDEVVEDVSHPHNDYLRLAYDYGFIGLGIYLATLAAQIMAVVRAAGQARGFKRIILYCIATSFIPYLTLMITDNVVLYAAYFGNIQYAIIGLGLSRGPSDG
jgi:O-antigen ligase